MYGAAVELNGAVDLLAEQIDTLFKSFAIQATDSSVPPLVGTLRRYEQAEVVRRLSSSAVRVATPAHGASPLMELYQERERFWLVDDRWGMAEINLIKGTWRSWILPRPTLDATRCAEMAVLWPLAQVLRGRGLHLLPAASVARDGWGVLLLCPFNIDLELTHLSRGGWSILGHRWSCVREDEGKPTLLHVPGSMKLLDSQRLLPQGRQQGQVSESTMTGSVSAPEAPQSASCEVIATFEPSRRPVAHAKELSGQMALDALRRNWPIVELHRARRHLPVKLAGTCRCCDVRLSKRSDDLLVLLTSLQNSKRQGPPTPMPSAFRTERDASSPARY